MNTKIKHHREVWKNKKILRIVYTDWYNSIADDLHNGKGVTLELGSGGGNFKEYKDDIITSDIEECEWLDMCFDAHNMPFDNDSVANIVMIDVLHHLANPIVFLNEAYRVLEKRGRIILIEPFPSPFSLIIYKLFHPEPFIFSVDYFKKNEELRSKHPWEANQAIAYLLFYRGERAFKKFLGKKLQIIKKKKMSCLLYPASGGFEHKAMIPDFLIPLFKLGEVILLPFRWLLAFRCYVIIEKN